MHAAAKFGCHFIFYCLILCSHSHEVATSVYHPYNSAVSMWPTEGTCSVHLDLLWPRHIRSWERDKMSRPRDINLSKRHIKSWERDKMILIHRNVILSWGNVIKCRGHEILIRRNVILSPGNVIKCRGHEILICRNVILSPGNVIKCRGHEILILKFNKEKQGA